VCACVACMGLLDPFERGLIQRRRQRSRPAPLPSQPVATLDQEYINFTLKLIGEIRQYFTLVRAAQAQMSAVGGLARAPAAPLSLKLLHRWRPSGSPHLKLKLPSGLSPPRSPLAHPPRRTCMQRSASPSSSPCASTCQAGCQSTRVAAGVFSERKKKKRKHYASSDRYRLNSTAGISLGK